MHWETETFLWLTLLQYSLLDGLEPNSQYLWSLPVWTMDYYSVTERNGVLRVYVIRFYVNETWKHCEKEPDTKGQGSCDPIYLK